MGASTQSKSVDQVPSAGRTIDDLLQPEIFDWADEVDEVSQIDTLGTRETSLDAPSDTLTKPLQLANVNLPSAKRIASTTCRSKMHLLPSSSLTAIDSTQMRIVGRLFCLAHGPHALIPKI